MASVSEIAHRAGVSKSTVSLVLNNRPNVSRRMRERVMRAISELEASVTPAQGPQRKGKSILLIHPLSMGSHQVFRELLQGVRSSIVEEARGQLTLAAHDPPLRPDHATSALLHDPALRPDGVIVMAAAEEDPIIEETLREGLPCVLLARQHAPEGTSAVGMDNARGMRTAVEHLVHWGHRRIAFLGGDRTFDYTDLRLSGYRDGMRSAGLKTQVFLGSGSQATKEFLQEYSHSPEEAPTAVVFVNDEHAAAGVPLLRAAGLDIPRDLSVIGFDDSDSAVELTPPLTSVRVPRYLIGKLAGRAVLDHIAYPELEHATIVLRTELVQRESVSNPRR